MSTATLTLSSCSTGNSSALITGSAAALASPTVPLIVQPEQDIVGYLAARKPQPDPQLEPALWVTIPAKVRAEVENLLAAFKMVTRRVRDLGLSVSRACAEVLPIFTNWHWSLKRFRAQFDEFTRKRDWVCLVNRSSCPAAWRSTSVGLPPEFIKFCAIRFGQYKREDGKRQALMSIKRQWKCGRNDFGFEEVIPGYEAVWKTRVRELYPTGWHYSNILRQVKKSGRFTKSIRALLHEGEAAARAHLPQNLMDRSQMRFMEMVTFDDVRLDWHIFNPKTGKNEELWLLVARDEATRMILGFVMHPATERDDGRCLHLGLAQMKQLAGWLLERYPLPPYVVTWKVERGTATLSEAMKLALGELLGHRINISFTQMIGDSLKDGWQNQNRVRGYREKAKGNSRGKASHESHNRLIHTQTSFVGGQIGRHYGVRPAELDARAAEAVEIWNCAQLLPAHLRGETRYPLLTIPQAREQLFKICNEQNSRTDHKLQGFAQVVEWLDANSVWHRGAPPAGERVLKLLKRMESPAERAARLVQGLEWTPVSPDIVAAFYEHTQRIVVVKDNGEIKFDHDEKAYYFRHTGAPLVPGTKVLAHFHPDDPKFLHLTDGKGSVLGTWLRRDRVAFGDKNALEEAMRYTALARATAVAAAAALAAPEREQLAAMRVHNAELMKLAEFTDVTAAPKAIDATVGAPVGAALTAVAKAVKADRIADEKAETAADTAAANELLDALRNDSPTE